MKNPRASNLALLQSSSFGIPRSPSLQTHHRLSGLKLILDFGASHLHHIGIPNSILLLPDSKFNQFNPPPQPPS